MKNLNPSKNKNAVILYFFLISSIITLAKVEDRFSVPINFTHIPSQIETELVVPAVTYSYTSFYNLLIPVKLTADFTSKHIDQSFINSLFLIYFNEYISYQIKSNKHNFVESNQIITTLQKSNITHLSSEEHSS